MTFRDLFDAPERQILADDAVRVRLNEPYRTVFKRALDIALVLVTLPIWLPLVLGMMAIVSLKGGRPIYRQTRLGRDGRPFTMIKIRTMVPDADALLGPHLAADPDAHAEWSTAQKLKRDPRITRIGQFLRKNSMDELPQLWNVLKGDMSLIGPRPMMTEQRPLYPGTSYFDLRPGITGLWQISDRNETSFAERAEFDNAYHQSLSFKQDVVILLKTIGVVLRGTGY